MNKRYGIGNKTIKIISCLLTLVLFGLAVSFQNSAMAGATAEQEDINEDLTISAEADGKKPEINAENPDELDGVIEREVKANEKSDRIDPPVEKQDSDDPNELAEYFPAVLEDPIPLPSSFSQGRFNDGYGIARYHTCLKQQIEPGMQVVKQQDAELLRLR